MPRDQKEKMRLAKTYLPSAAVGVLGGTCIKSLEDRRKPTGPLLTNVCCIVS